MNKRKTPVSRYCEIFKAKPDDCITWRTVSVEWWPSGQFQSLIGGSLQWTRKILNLDTDPHSSFCFPFLRRRSEAFDDSKFKVVGAFLGILCSGWKTVPRGGFDIPGAFLKKRLLEAQESQQFLNDSKLKSLVLFLHCRWKMLNKEFRIQETWSFLRIL